MTWERGTLADFLGDYVVYRNLEPMRRDMRGLRAVWADMGLPHYYIPRKTEPEYARALVSFLHQAQRVRGVSASLERLLFIGDTLMNDGTAARNVGQHLPLMGFIGSDRLTQPRRVEIDGELMVANRWGALADFVEWLRASRFPCDERTALLIDLDKTSLGARGRNDQVIDSARVRAVQRTMRAALGEGFDVVSFRMVYDRLNQPRYHHFTADNQDYLAYICLMVSGGACASADLWRELADGRLSTIADFVARCDARRSRMSSDLLAAHEEVRHGLEVQDPTPFKGFRRGEYLETIACMDVLPDDATEEEVLSSEIVITAEVSAVAGYMAERGVLLFGISDKPDEASVPTIDQAAEGYRPIHRAVMKMYGTRAI